VFRTRPIADHLRVYVSQGRNIFFAEAEKVAAGMFLHVIASLGYVSRSNELEERIVEMYESRVS
jgi:hypothetical protein